MLLDAETGDLIPHFAQIDVQALQEPGVEPDQVSTMLRPVVRLRDGARYIVAFRDVTNRDGAVIEASAEFAALRDGTGDCEELSSLFIALCRAHGIPARTVWVPDHCYPEFYLAGFQLPDVFLGSFGTLR